MTLQVMHISDLHFGPYFMPQVAELLLAKVSELNPDVMVVSGDFTQRAKPQEFIDARQYLERLGAAPQVVCPGNHDVPLYRVWERLFSPHALYCEHISRELNSALEGRCRSIEVAEAQMREPKVCPDGWLPWGKLGRFREVLPGRVAEAHLKRSYAAIEPSRCLFECVGRWRWQPATGIDDEVAAGRSYRQYDRHRHPDDPARARCT